MRTGVARIEPITRAARVSMSITNYDGAIGTTPREHVHPKTVEELQNILRRTDSYPSLCLPKTPKRCVD